MPCVSVTVKEAEIPSEKPPVEIPNLLPILAIAGAIGLALAIRR